VIRDKRRSSYGPPVEIPQKLTSPHPENSSLKSFIWKILSLSPFDVVFCGHFFGPSFCFQYFAQEGGRGVGQSSVASSHLSVRKGELCRPYGTRSFFPLHPGLRCAPSWANCTSTPFGVRFLRGPFQQRRQNRVFTFGEKSNFATRLANFERRQRGPVLSCHADSAKSEPRRAKSMGAAYAC
jgi:hypothetical protein